LTKAIEVEVAEWIEAHQHSRDERGHRQVVRNGHLPELYPKVVDELS
jgi:hypothetical protein